MTDLSNYTFVPYNEGTRAGAYVRNDVYRKAVDFARSDKFEDEGLETFFGDVWKGVKDVVSFGVGVITGSNGIQLPPIVVQAPDLEPEVKKATDTMLIVGVGIAAAILLSKK